MVIVLGIDECEFALCKWNWPGIMEIEFEISGGVEIFATAILANPSMLAYKSGFLSTGKQGPAEADNIDRKDTVVATV